MAIIIFCGDEKRHGSMEKVLSMLKGNTVKIYEESYRDVKSKIQKSIQEINVLNHNYLKSERYELYLIAKRYGVPYCIVNFPINDPEGASAKNRYDNPYIEGDLLEEDWIKSVLRLKVRRSMAHAKTIVDAEYLSNVKRAIEKVNKKYKNLFFFEEIERQMIGILHKNPVPLCNVEESYEKLVLKAIDTRR